MVTRFAPPASAKRPLGDFWRGFDWPALGRISGIYGSQRILNGQPRQPHYGIDIAAPTGTPVYAPASGLVTLVKDLYFSGWTVVIAHGLGVNSSFLHLDRVDVKPGMMVERGGLIGTIGATGRATGPHLDWRIDWQGRRIDPGLLVGAMPDPAS
jgi:murein DD-endopeptidase MepM/ murein hydrolase activator NlpD